MPVEYKKIRIFVASPGDVQIERSALARVIEEVNITISAIAPEKNIGLELVRWETHVHPGLGLDAQQVVNQQVPDYDIFIGILWKLMGTPTAVARSGTEQEFRRAYEIWQKDRKLPVLFYFCQQAFPPPRTKEEVEQLGKVVDFRAELSKKGLIADYPDHEGFADVIRPHLMLVLGKMFSPQKSTSATIATMAERVSDSENLIVRQQITSLAQKYETIRSSMDPSDTRTRKMESVVSEMGTLALRAYGLLPELTASRSPGQRLAAVIILQLTPRPDYIHWLAERLNEEKPFVCYHAAMALLNAVRELHSSHAQELSKTIAVSKERLLAMGVAKSTDRYAVLDEAEQELNQLSKAAGRQTQRDLGGED